MKIAVCIKQVPFSTEINIDQENGTLIRTGIKSQINPYDIYALEEALLIKEKYNGKISVYTMGPPQAESILRDALALGADEAFLISHKDFAGADTLATSYALSKAVTRENRPDIIICGKQAIDGDTAQVGPSLSQLLGYSLSTEVQKIKNVTASSITVEQMMDNGYYEVKLTLPALITVVKDINNPRTANLKNRLKSLNQKISVYSPDDLEAKTENCGLKGSPTNVYKSYCPAKSKNCEILKGSVEELTKILGHKIISITGKIK